MTEREFLANTVGDQNRIVCYAVCGQHVRRGASNKFVNGGWAEFGEMWDALPVGTLTDAVLTRFGTSAGTEFSTVKIMEEGATVIPPLACDFPNLAVALALLKARGVIEEN